jgi:hypothetical protein
MDGLGNYKWSKGHSYKGSFKDGMMEGQGKFVHSNGRESIGEFKRDLFAFVSFSLPNQCRVINALLTPWTTTSC